LLGTAQFIGTAYYGEGNDWTSWINTTYTSTRGISVPLPRAHLSLASGTDRHVQ